MRALLWKDAYTLAGEMRFMLLILAVFAVLPGTSTAAFAMIYGVMLPYTAIAYEERSKWSQYAVMMPYSPKAVVCEKYVLGWCILGGICLLSVLSQLLTGLIKGAVDVQGLVSVVAVAGVALLLLAVSMPLNFRFGVEKGRLIFLLVGVAVAFLMLYIANTSAGTGAVQISGAAVGQAGGIGRSADWFVAVGLPLTGLLAQPISIWFALRAWRKANFI